MLVCRISVSLPGTHHALMFHKAFDLPLEEGLRLERRLFHGLFATSDQKEGESDCFHSNRALN